MKTNDKILITIIVLAAAAIIGTVTVNHLIEENDKDTIWPYPPPNIITGDHAKTICKILEIECTDDMSFKGRQLTHLAKDSVGYNFETKLKTIYFYVSQDHLSYFIKVLDGQPVENPHYEIYGLEHLDEDTKNLIKSNFNYEYGVFKTDLINGEAGGHDEEYLPIACTLDMVMHLVDHSNIFEANAGDPIMLNFMGLPESIDPEKFDICFEELRDNFRDDLSSDGKFGMDRIKYLD